LVAQDYLALVHSSDLDGLQSAWNSALGSPGEVLSYSRTLTELTERGELGTALDLGLRMIEALEQAGRAADAFELGLAIVGKQTNNESFSKRLFALIQRAFGSTDWLPVALEASGLSETNLVPAAFEAFELARRFTPGHVVYHRAGWGEGVVEELDAAARTVRIRFVSGGTKELPLKSALESLRPLERDDLRTMRLTRVDDLAKLAEEDPASVIRMAARMYRGTINSLQLKTELVGTITEKKWAGWWKRAKVAASNDPWLQVDGSATRPVFVLRRAPLSLADEARKSLSHARSLPEYLETCRDYLARGLDDRAQGLILDLAQQRVEKDLHGSGESAAHLVDGILFLAEHGRPTSISAAHEMRELLMTPSGLTPENFDNLATQASREHAVRLLPEALGEDWADQCAAAITRFPMSVIEHLIALMQEKKKAGALSPVWAAIAPYPRRYPTLTWLLAKLHSEGAFEGREDAPDNPTVCRVMLHLCRMIATDPRSDAAMHRVMQRIASLLTGRKGPLTRCLETIGRDDLAAFLGIAERGNNEFPQEITDAILRSVARRFPDITSKPERPFWEHDELIFVTTEGYQRRREEYRVLVDVKIPLNAKSIGAAAALGDLSENSEWESAMEEQRNLTGRAEDMTRELRRAKLIEDQEIPDGIVTPGTRVGITWLDDGTQTKYRVLGPWDCIADDIINYKAPLGASLVGCRPSEEVVFESQDGPRRIRIDTVERIV
jgi:transcription elongation factor GreA